MKDTAAESKTVGIYRCMPCGIIVGAATEGKKGELMENLRLGEHSGHTITEVPAMRGAMNAFELGNKGFEVYPDPGFHRRKGGNHGL